MKHQVLFSMKNNEKIFMNVVCCSRDWRFKGYRKGICFKRSNDLHKTTMMDQPWEYNLQLLSFTWPIITFFWLKCFYHPLTLITNCKYYINKFTQNRSTDHLHSVTTSYLYTNLHLFLLKITRGKIYRQICLS